VPLCPCCRSSRNANLPRINVLLGEIEQMSGGIMVEQQGTSIWVAR
jgi:hypothetical protein